MTFATCVPPPCTFVDSASDDTILSAASAIVASTRDRCRRRIDPSSIRDRLHICVRYTRADPWRPRDQLWVRGTVTMKASSKKMASALAGVDARPKQVFQRLISSRLLTVHVDLLCLRRCWLVVGALSLFSKCRSKFPSRLRNGDKIDGLSSCSS